MNENNIGSLLAAPRYVECYTALAKERIVFLSEDVTKDVASELSALLLHYDAENDTDDISIYINTNGGDADALANIYDVMQMIKSPVKTICIGKAYSAGALLLAAGAKGKRLIAKNACVMIHGLQCLFPDTPLAHQKDTEIYFDWLQKHNRMILGILAKHTGKSIEKIEADCKIDNYLDAKQALDYGIVDAII